MRAVHYREPDAHPEVGAVCGRKSGPSTTITADPKQVTCRACPSTTRWLMSVKGMTWAQAQQHRYPRY